MARGRSRTRPVAISEAGHVTDVGQDPAGTTDPMPFGPSVAGPARGRWQPERTIAFWGGWASQTELRLD
jgi:hypothetical protein